MDKRYMHGVSQFITDAKADREWEPCLLPMQRLQESKELSPNSIYTIALDYQGVHAKLYDIDYAWRGWCECSVGKR